MNQSRHRVRSTVPLAVAAAALVLSGAGGAVAGSMITGAQIKNGTITGADVRDGTITSADVRNGSLAGADVNAATRAAFGRVAGYQHLRTTVAFAEAEVKSFELGCSPGRHVLHGSAVWNYDTDAVPVVVREDSTGVYGFNASSSHTGGDLLVVEVVCAPVTGTTAVVEQ